MCFRAEPTGQEQRTHRCEKSPLPAMKASAGCRATARRALPARNNAREKNAPRHRNFAATRTGRRTRCRAVRRWSVVRHRRPDPATAPDAATNHRTPREKRAPAGKQCRVLASVFACREACKSLEQGFGGIHRPLELLLRRWIAAIAYGVGRRRDLRERGALLLRIKGGAAHDGGGRQAVSGRQP